MKWDYPRVTGKSVQGRDLAADNFATEKRQPLAVLIREATQNPLDARNPASQEPVRISFRHLKGAALNGEFLRSIIDDDFIARLNASSPKLKFLPPDEPSVLLIEDFGTVGLEGAFDNPDVSGPGQNWNAFFFREGEGSKASAASNGRAGQGKVTLYRSSSARAVLALTTRASDGATLLMGRSSFQRTYDAPGGGRCERHSFWHCGTGDVAEPTRDEDLICTFQEAFHVERVGKPGVSLVLPYPSDFDAKDAIACLVADFFLPIARGRLVATVDDVALDAESIEAVASQYLSDEQARALYSPYTGDYRKFVARTLSLHGPLVTVSSAWAKAGKARLADADFPDGGGGDLKAALLNGDLVAVRFPIRVRERDCAPVESHFDVYLEMPDELDTTEEAYIREDLLIGDERALSAATHLPPARGLTLVTDKAISALLADAEEPTHLKWNGSRPRLVEDYEGAREALTAVRQAMPRLLAYLSNAGTKRDTKALSRFFPRVDEQGVGTSRGHKQRERGQGQDEQVTNIPPSPPRPFHWDHGSTWDRVYSHADTDPAILPVDCEVRFAYEGLDSDAFAAYDPFDFDLDNDEFSVEASGATVRERRENVLKVTVDAFPFELKVDGFSPNIRRRMRIDYTFEDNATDHVDE